MAVANAHPLGAKPFERADYIRKFQTITDGIISTRESNRFLEAAQSFAESCSAGELAALNIALRGTDRTATACPKSRHFS